MEVLLTRSGFLARRDSAWTVLWAAPICLSFSSHYTKQGRIQAIIISLWGLGFFVFPKWRSEISASSLCWNWQRATWDYTCHSSPMCFLVLQPSTDTGDKYALMIIKRLRDYWQAENQFVCLFVFHLGTHFLLQYVKKTFLFIKSVF